MLTVGNNTGGRGEFAPVGGDVGRKEELRHVESYSSIYRRMWDVEDGNVCERRINRRSGRVNEECVM